jgi:hypothetical protein
MFLETNPELPNLLDGETNNNIEVNEKLGQFELPFSIENELNINPNMVFSYTIQHVDAQYKLHLKEINNVDHKIKIILPLNNTNNQYSIFIPHRLDYLSKNTKYLNVCMTMKKCDYAAKRYILQINIYLNKSDIDELYEGITNSNVAFMSVKDILIFVFTNGMYSNTLNHKIKMENIKNNSTDLHVLTKEYKIKPFNYQLENINWCKNLESHINNSDSITNTTTTINNCDSNTIITSNIITSSIIAIVIIVIVIVISNNDDDE